MQLKSRVSEGTLGDAILKKIFELPLSTHATNSSIAKLNFMDFPKVALISFEKMKIAEKNCT